MSDLEKLEELEEELFGMMSYSSYSDWADQHGGLIEAIEAFKESKSKLGEFKEAFSEFKEAFEKAEGEGEAADLEKRVDSLLQGGYVEPEGLKKEESKKQLFSKTTVEKEDSGFLEEMSQELDRLKKSSRRKAAEPGKKGAEVESVSEVETEGLTPLPKKPAPKKAAQADEREDAINGVRKLLEKKGITPPAALSKKTQVKEPREKLGGIENELAELLETLPEERSDDPVDEVLRKSRGYIETALKQLRNEELHETANGDRPVSKLGTAIEKLSKLNDPKAKEAAEKLGPIVNKLMETERKEKAVKIDAKRRRLEYKSRLESVEEDARFKNEGVEKLKQFFPDDYKNVIQSLGIEEKDYTKIIGELDELKKEKIDELDIDSLEEKYEKVSKYKDSVLVLGEQRSLLEAATMARDADGFMENLLPGEKVKLAVLRGKDVDPADALHSLQTQTANDTQNALRGTVILNVAEEMIHGSRDKNRRFLAELVKLAKSDIAGSGGVKNTAKKLDKKAREIEKSWRTRDEGKSAAAPMETAESSEKQLKAFVEGLKKRGLSNDEIDPLPGKIGRLIAQQATASRTKNYSGINDLENDIKRLINKPQNVEVGAGTTDLSPILRDIWDGTISKKDAERLLEELSRPEFDSNKQGFNEALKFYREIDDEELEKDLDGHEERIGDWLDRWYVGLSASSKSELAPAAEDLRRKRGLIKNRKAALELKRGDYASYERELDNLEDEALLVGNRLKSTDEGSFETDSEEALKFFNKIIEVSEKTGRMADAIDSLGDDGKYRPAMFSSLNPNQDGALAKKLAGAVDSCHDLRLERDILAFRFGKRFLVKEEDGDFKEEEDEPEAAFDSYRERARSLAQKVKGLEPDENAAEVAAGKATPLFNLSLGKLKEYGRKAEEIEKEVSSSKERGEALKERLERLKGIHGSSVLESVEREVKETEEKISSAGRGAEEAEKLLEEEVGQRYSDVLESVKSATTYQVSIRSDDEFPDIDETPSLDEEEMATTLDELSYEPVEVEVTVDAGGEADIVNLKADIELAEKELEKVETKAGELADSGLLDAGQKRKLKEALASKKKELEEARKSVEEAKGAISGRRKEDGKRLDEVRQLLDEMNGAVSSGVSSSAGWESLEKKREKAGELLEEIDFTLIGKGRELLLLSKGIEKIDGWMERENPEMRAKNLMKEELPSYSEKLAKSDVEASVRKLDRLESTYVEIEGSLDGELKSEVAETRKEVEQRKSKFEKRLSDIETFIGNYQELEEAMLTEARKVPKQLEVGDVERVAKVIRSIHGLEKELKGWENTADENGKFAKTAENVSSLMKERLRELVRQEGNERLETARNYIPTTKGKAEVHRKVIFAKTVDKLESLKKRIADDLEKMGESIDTAKKNFKEYDSKRKDAYGPLAEMEKKALEKAKEAKTRAEKLVKTVDKKIEVAEKVTGTVKELESSLDSLREAEKKVRSGRLRGGPLSPKKIDSLAKENEAEAKLQVQAVNSVGRETEKLLDRLDKIKNFEFYMNERQVETVKEATELAERLILWAKDENVKPYLPVEIKWEESDLPQAYVSYRSELASLNEDLKGFKASWQMRLRETQDTLIGGEEIRPSEEKLVSFLEYSELLSFSETVNDLRERMEAIRERGDELLAKAEKEGMLGETTPGGTGQYGEVLKGTANKVNSVGNSLSSFERSINKVLERKEDQKNAVRKSAGCLRNISGDIEEAKNLVYPSKRSKVLAFFKRERRGKLSLENLDRWIEEKDNPEEIRRAFIKIRDLYDKIRKIDETFTSIPNSSEYLSEEELKLYEKAQKGLEKLQVWTRDERVMSKACKRLSEMRIYDELNIFTEEGEKLEGLEKAKAGVKAIENSEKSYTHDQLVFTRKALKEGEKELERLEQKAHSSEPSILSVYRNVIQMEKEILDYKSEVLKEEEGKFYQNINGTIETISEVERRLKKGGKFTVERFKNHISGLNGQIKMVSGLSGSLEGNRGKARRFYPSGEAGHEETDPDLTKRLKMIADGLEISNSLLNSWKSLNEVFAGVKGEVKTAEEHSFEKEAREYNTAPGRPSLEGAVTSGEVDDVVEKLMVPLSEKYRKAEEGLDRLKKWNFDLYSPVLDESSAKLKALGEVVAFRKAVASGSYAGLDLDSISEAAARLGNLAGPIQAAVSELKAGRSPQYVDAALRSYDKVKEDMDEFVSQYVRAKRAGRLEKFEPIHDVEKRKVEEARIKIAEKAKELGVADYREIARAACLGESIEFKNGAERDLYHATEKIWTEKRANIEKEVRIKAAEMKYRSDSTTMKDAKVLLEEAEKVSAGS